VTAVVHETIRHQTTELVEPKVTRDVHRYHQYDYIQPIEVTIPADSYATNARGEVIHAPGGLTTQAGERSHWEQERQDRGYALPSHLRGHTDQENTSRETGRDRIEGPFPIKDEGGGEHILHHIRDGGIARRFGGNLTSTTQAPETNIEEQPPPRPRGGVLQENTAYLQSSHSQAPRTPPRGDSFHSTQEDISASDPTTAPATPPNRNPTSRLDESFNRLSLDHPNQRNSQHTKPLPALPDTSPRSPPHGVRRMSADNKLRNRYSMDSKRSSESHNENQNMHENQNYHENPIIDEDSVPERGSSVRKTRIY
jgi:hypothetical protein